MRNDLVYKITKVVVILSLLIIGLIFLLFREPKSIILGYIFGAAISILSFLLINDSANKLIRMNPSKAKFKAISNYILRFFIYFIVLFISAKADYLNLLSAFIGLNMVKIAIYFLTFTKKDFTKTKSR